MGLYTPHLDSRDIVAGFYPALEAGMEQIWAPRLGQIVPSSSETETYKWLGQVPVMRQWVAGRNEQYLKKYSHTVTNYKYEVTLPIELDDLRRDKTAQIRQRISDLGTRTATHWNKFASEWIDVSDAATKGLAYDGQFFIDTDHNESGSNQTNDLTATEVPSSNVSATTTLTVTEAANILNEVAAHFCVLTDDQGEPINQGPMNLIVMTTAALHAAGIRQAISAEILTASADNPLRGLQREGWSFTVIHNSRLTTGARLFFFIADGGVNSPLILQDEYGVETQLLGVGSDEEFKNDRHIFGAKASRGVGYGLWQKSAMVTLT